MLFFRGGAYTLLSMEKRFKYQDWEINLSGMENIHKIEQSLERSQETFLREKRKTERVGTRYIYMHTLLNAFQSGLQTYHTLDQHDEHEQEHNEHSQPMLVPI
jgi:hypothetical protein